MKAAPWCRWRRGTSPVLLVAPHGGRRAAQPWNDRRDPKVNDLHTADLATALAERLEASLIVNRSLDRNILDLNRISQVVRQAPWFVSLIEDLIGGILNRHEHAEVLFVHGWNVVQPRCDIGIGGSFGDEEEAGSNGDKLTAAPGYVATRLAAFRRDCESRGLRVTYGERYPASHHNNLVQLFRHRGGRPLPVGARLAEWAAAGRVHGVQLELGIPLRWPGAMRERFVAAAGRAFGPPAFSPSAAVPPRPASSPSQEAEPAALEFYDPGCGIGFSASLGVDRRRSMATARLLVLSGRRQAALFVGENPQARPHGQDGPRFESAAGRIRLRFDGHVLELEDGAEYVRLEDAFARSTLVPLQADLELRDTTRGGHGRVVGAIRSASRSWRIDCHGFGRATALDRPSSLDAEHVSFAASFGGEVALRARSGSPARVVVIAPEGEQSHEPSAFEVDLEPDRVTPRRFALAFGDGRELRAEPISRLAIVRPLANGGRARTTIGAARFRSRDYGRGYGFYEYSIPLAPGAASPQT